MKDKDLIKKLKKLKETPIKREILISLSSDLKKYMGFYPIKKGIEIKTGEVLPFFGMPILKAAIFILIVILALGGGGAVFASQKSLPGDILYPVKILTENLQATLTFNDQKKAYLYTRLGEKRIEEIRDILEKRGVEPKRLSIAEERLAMHVTNAKQIVRKELAKERNDEFSEKIEDKLNNLEIEQERLEEEIEIKEKAEEALREAEEDDDFGDLDDEEDKEEEEKLNDNDDENDNSDNDSGNDSNDIEDDHSNDGNDDDEEGVI